MAFYVGQVENYGPLEVFEADKKPSFNELGKKYRWVIGPFTTESGARYYQNNRHMCKGSIEDIEAMAQIDANRRKRDFVRNAAPYSESVKVTLPKGVETPADPAVKLPESHGAAADFLRARKAFRSMPMSNAGAQDKARRRMLWQKKKLGKTKTKSKSKRETTKMIVIPADVMAEAVDPVARGRRVKKILKAYSGAQRAAEKMRKSGHYSHHFNHKKYNKLAHKVWSRHSRTKGGTARVGGGPRAADFSDLDLRAKLRRRGDKSGAKHVAMNMKWSAVARKKNKVAEPKLP